MFYNPVIIKDSNDWIADCSRIQKELGILNPLVFTTERTNKRLQINELFDNDRIITSIIPNPTINSCQNIVNHVSKISSDGVIAIGGGSVMDTAKAIMAVLSTGETNISRILTHDQNYREKIPSIFIPTNHGTGSEVTKWGTIWDFENNKKYSVSNKFLYPTVAVLDPNLCLSLPLDQSIIVTLDALSHSFESLWSKDSNEISTKYAIDAIVLIIKNIPRLKDNPNDIKARYNLLKASNLAGLAFSNTMTNIAHSISYPLTSIFNIPHGIASSITLVPILKLCLKEIESEVKIICKMLRLNNSEQLITLMNEIPVGVIDYNLSKWKISKEDIPIISKNSFTKIDKGIIDLDKEDVNNILFSIL